MRYLLCLWIGCLLLSEAGAQSGYHLSGLITDTARQPLRGALVQVKALLPAGVVRTVATDSSGRWQVPNFEQPVFNIQVTCAGYAGYTGDCYFPATRHSIQLQDIRLHASSNTLKTVDVSARVPPVVIKQDTVEYNAGAYNVRKDADVEDLLKKLPGLKVNRDGTVIAQGKVVTRVKVNGKDFFDGDIRTATRNLPANIVDKVQVVNDYGEAANFTGFRNTEAEKIINIQLKKDARHGYFVKLQNGAGTDQRYDLANAFSYFDDAQQVSAFVNSNNVNNSGLARSLNSPYFGNLSRLMGTNKNIVEGLGGASGVSSLVNNQDFGFLSAVPDYGNGTAGNTSVGVRYSFDRNQPFSFYSSYLYFYSKRWFDYTASGKELFDPPQIIDQQETLTSTTNTGAHRAFMNVAYKPDSSLSIRLIPSLQCLQENMSAFPGTLNLAANTKINATASHNEMNSRKHQLSLNLVLKKKFGKTGRSLFFESVFENKNNSSEAHNHLVFFTPASQDTSLQQITDDGSYRACDNKLLFTAPLSKKLMYQVYYSFRYSRSNTGRNTAFFNDTTGRYQTSKAYSGNIVSAISTNTGGAMLKLQAGKATYTAGAALQSNRFERTGDMLPPYHQTTVNFLPLLQADYKISGTAALQVLYNGAVHPADPSQLLPVTDTSNPLIVFRGNIRLKPEFTNALHLSYYRFSFVDGDVVLLHASYVHVLNKIIPAVELSNDGKTLISLVNTAYSRDISLYYNISRPFSNKTFEITWGGNISTSRYAFYNNVTHVINTFRINQGLEFAYNRDWAEFTAGAGLNTQHFLFKQSIEPVTDLSFTQRTNFYFTGWKAGTDLSLICPSGYLLPRPGNTIWLLNAHVEKNLAKRLLVKVTVNDLLNRSSWNYSRVMRDNYVTDYQYNVPGRYLLLFITYQLNRFR